MCTTAYLRVLLALARDRTEALAAALRPPRLALVRLVVLVAMLLCETLLLGLALCRSWPTLVRDCASSVIFFIATHVDGVRSICIDDDNTHAEANCGICHRTLGLRRPPANVWRRLGPNSPAAPLGL